MKNPETAAISGFCSNLHFHSAEKEGFEPPVHRQADNGFQDRRIRPLCHFSFLSSKALAKTECSKDNIFLISGNFMNNLAKYQIFNEIQNLLTGCEQTRSLKTLNISSGAEIQLFSENKFYCLKIANICLKVALFAEKR